MNSLARTRSPLPAVPARRSPFEELHRALYNPAAQDIDSPWIELLHKRSEAPLEKVEKQEREESFLEEHGEFLIPLSILGGAALFIWWQTRQRKTPPVFFPQPPAPAPTASTPTVPAPTATAATSSPETPITP